jgi:hypothetical protein
MINPAPSPSIIPKKPKYKFVEGGDLGDTMPDVKRLVPKH